jgi:hypothetical protein
VVTGIKAADGFDPKLPNDVVIELEFETLVDDDELDFEPKLPNEDEDRLELEDELELPDGFADTTSMPSNEIEVMSTATSRFLMFTSPLY